MRGELIIEEYYGNKCIKIGLRKGNSVYWIDKSDIKGINYLELLCCLYGHP